MSPRTDKAAPQAPGVADAGHHGPDAIPTSSETVAPAPEPELETNRPAGRMRRIGSMMAGERFISLISPFILLLLWEMTAQTGLVDTRFFPPPSGIAETFWNLAASGELWANTRISGQRVLFGFLMGGIPAIVLGLAMGLYRPVRAFFDPLISATYPVPKSALLPLVLLIFGLGEMSKVVIVAIGVFFPLAINTTAGVLEINKTYHEVGKTYGASQWQRFKTIAFPGALPLIMTGIKLGVGMGLVLIAIAEMIGAREGLGFMIWNAWQIFAVERMYVGLIMIALLGVLLTALLREVEKKVIPWRNTG